MFKFLIGLIVGVTFSVEIQSFIDSLNITEKVINQLDKYETTREEPKVESPMTFPNQSTVKKEPEICCTQVKPLN